MAVASVAAAMAGYLTFGVTVVLGAVGSEFGAPEDARPGSIAFNLGFSASVLAVVLTVIRLGSLGSVLLTRLADRYGRRRLLLLAYAIGAGASLFTAASAALAMFVVLQIVARSGLTSANSLVSTIAAEETEVAHRSRAVAAVAAAWGGGAGIAAVVYALVKGSRLGWRGLYLGAAGALLLLPFLRAHVRETRRFAALPAPEPHRLARLWARPYRRRLLTLSSMHFLIALQATPAAGFALIFAEKVRGLPSGTIAVVVLLAGPPGLAGLVASGWLSDRIGRRVTAATGVLVATAAAIGIYAGPRALFALAYWLFVTGGALAGPALGTITAELFPTSARATALSVLGGLGILSGALSLSVFGVLVDRMGGFGPAAVVLGLAPCLGVACMMALPETRGHEMEEISPDVVQFVRSPLL